MLPFLVLFPGAVWIGVSADGLFAGVTATGLALLASSAIAGGGVAVRRLGAGVLLGFGDLPVVRPGVARRLLAVAVPSLGRQWRAAALAVVAGAVAVVGRVRAGRASGGSTATTWSSSATTRAWRWSGRTAYWVWADLAARGRRRSVPRWWPPSGEVSRLRGGPCSPIRCSCSASLPWSPSSSPTSRACQKAETERIWLPFGVWLLPMTALLPRPGRRWWLAAQAATALAVNHLLLTGW